MDTSAFTPTWQDASKISKTIVQFGLSKVPVIGGLLSGLVGALWPSSAPAINPQAVWDAIKSQVDQDINNAIAQSTYTNLQLTLKGLKAAMDNYLDNTDTSDTANLCSYFDATNQVFSAAIPQFQVPGQETQLLPLFAPVAQMHLALLRDGVQFGIEKFGWNQTDLQNCINQLCGTSTQEGAITSYTNYVNTVYQANWTNGSDPVGMPGWVNFHNLLVEGALNYAYYWPFMDATKYSGALQDLLTAPNEVFCGPIGGSVGNYYVANFQTFDLNTQGMISGVQVWYGPSNNGQVRMRGIQVQYGPSVAPRMSSDIYRQNANFFKFTGTNYLPVTPTNPIIAVSGLAGDVVDGLTFQFQNGPSQGVPFGTNTPTSYNYQLQYTNPVTNQQEQYILSSILFNQGIDDGYNNNFEGFDLSGLIFGFRDPASYPPAQRSYQPSPALTLTTFDGTVTNQDGSQTTASLTITTLTGNTFEGQLTFYNSTLSGDGPVNGICNGNQIQFTTTDDNNATITWTGQLNGSSLGGSYSASDAQGTWQMSQPTSGESALMGTYTGSVNNSAGGSATCTLVLTDGGGGTLGGSITLNGLGGGGVLTGAYNAAAQTVQLITQEDVQITWNGQVANSTLSGSYQTAEGETGTWSVTLQSA